MYPVSRMPGAPACLAACVCLALFPLLAHADAPESIKTLDTLVVTSAAPSSPLNWVTDPRLPRQPVPASDGADYLKTVPGFSAIRNGGTNGDPVLRGMSGSRLNILSNDGSLIGACPSRMDNPLSYIAPETYDRLTVVKGPQSVRWGAGASAGTVRFERDMPRFDAPGMELQASALGGSNNRNDQMLDASFGSRPGYVRVNGNRSESGDYRDGNGEVVPSRWRKWNADAAIGWTPDADTVLELNAGTGDALARYAGRGMDGAAFKRSSSGLRFERGNLPGAWDKLQANLYYNDADHLMDTYPLRTPNPASYMPMPMASKVEQFNQLNSATISALPIPGQSSGDGLAAIIQIANEVMPEGFFLDYSGQSRLEQTQGNTLMIAFAAAVLVIYLVLAAQFESFRDPFIILMSVPLTIFGAILPLNLGLGTLNIYSQVGMITLIGLITKHGILMVEFANQQREHHGLNRQDAIVLAAKTRLRPILMTTAAMALAVVPLVIADGAGAAAREAMGIVMFSGLLIGTMFTLFVVPMFYTFIAPSDAAMKAAEEKRLAAG